MDHANSPRHVVGVLPLLVVLAAPAWARVRAASEGTRVLFTALVVHALVVTALVASTFFYFQPSRANPLRDVTLALLARGITTPSVGTALGLEGLASLAPHALFTAALVVFVAVVLGRRTHVAALSLVVASLSTAVMISAAPEAHDDAVVAEVAALAETLGAANASWP